MIWMTLRRLDWALRTRGTAIADWPSCERTAALALLRRCSRARQMLADELAREDCPSQVYDAALLAGMQGRLRRRMVSHVPMVPAIRWGALAACVLAGLYLGIGEVDADQPDLFAAVQVIAIDAAL